ncbi:MAG: hypothetical protein EX272_01270 [Chromatiales bacterium]|nr:MAG: hypothetical protein EX272_01270 [Chromatiales bacterium]
MQQETRKLTKKEREELESLVALSTQVGRAVLFLVAVTAIGAVFRALQGLVSIDVPAWVLPTAAFGYWLYRRAGRWTGGPELRRRVRRDIDQGEARVTVIEPVDITEFEELEDEGPSYVIRTAGDDWLLLSGQEMLRHKRRGFPWSQFGVVEAPSSGVFFGLRKTGDSVPVTRTLPPMAYDLARDLGTFERTFVVLDEAGRALLADTTG